MSDFYNNEQNENESVFSASAARQKQREEQRQQNIDRYQVFVTDEQYDILNGLISRSDDPVEIENEGYRVANAMKYSEMYGIDLADAYRDLDMLNAANFGEGAFNTSKDWFKATVDSFTQGVKQLERNNVGKQIREAEELGNERYAQELYQTIAGIDEEIAGLQDTQSRNLLVTALKYGAQSAPFTAYSIASSAVGGLLGGGIGAVVLGTMSSYDAMRGEEYLQLREDGASVEVAGKIADTSALLQGIVEVSLGTVAGYAGNIVGKSPVSKAAADKITKNVFSRMYYSGAWKRAAAVAGKLGVDYFAEANEEGLEEVIQELISTGARALSAELEGYGVDGLTASEVAQNAWESYKGGFLGALVLGAPNVAFNFKATVQDFKDFNSAAQNIDSKEAFMKATADSPLLEGMSEKSKAEAQEEVYAKYEPVRNKRAEEARAMAADRAEVIDTADNVEETVEDESGRIVRDEEYRNKEGRLNYEESLIDTNEDGSTENQFVVKGKGNQEYGRILYNEDADGNITINDFVMSATRENLRQEVFTDFAEKFAGRNIEWDTRGQTASAVRDTLVNNNIRGAKNGLNYFADVNEVQNQRTRIKWDNQIREAIPNMDANQRTAGIALVESFANKHGQSLADYDMTVFNGKLFLDEASKEAYEQALKQGVKPENIGGYVDIDELGKSTKGIIYAAQKGDATTFVHENAHIFRRLLTADELAQAEKLFNVTDHNWTRQNEEDFAYALQGYAFEGKAVGEAKSLFDKLAQALVRVYNSLKGKIDFSPELSDFIEGLFADPTTALAQAKRAVEQNERASQSQLSNNSLQLNENEQIINDATNFTSDRVEAAVDEARNDTVDNLFYQLIGEKGAQNLDNAEEKTYRMDNLKVAIEMTSVGKDAKTIRLATGWEKGVDGKWRYEIDDTVFDVFGMAQFKKDHPRYARWDELTDKFFSDEGLTEEENKEYQELEENLVQPDINIYRERLINSQATLRDIVNGNELLEAYPELANVNVYFGKITGDYTTKGMYIPEENAIVLLKQNPGSVTWAKDARSVLIHEIQHVIQMIEGFATGGNLDTVSNMRFNSLVKDLAPIYAEIGSNEQLKEKVKAYKKALLEVDWSKEDVVDQMEKAISIRDNDEKLSGLWDKLQDISKKYHLEYNEDASRLFDFTIYDTDSQNAKEAFRIVRDIFKSSAYIDYRSIAGEVESRNVQARMNLTPEERLYTTLRATEDVAREDQIVLYDGSKSNSILFQNVTEEDFKNRVASVQHTEERKEYIDRYYNNIKNQYHEKEIEVEGQDRKITVEISDNINLKAKKTVLEIKAASKFIDMGFYVTLLSESQKIEQEKHVDALLNHEVLVEIKSPSGNANSIASLIKEGINKKNAEIITVFMIDNENISDEEILEKLELKKPYIEGSTDGIFIFRGDELSEIKIPEEGIKKFQSTGKSNNTTTTRSVNNQSQETNDNLLYQFIDVAGAMNLTDRVKSLYDRSEEMRDNGADMETIRKLTGYSIGPDGVFQYELNDSQNEIIDRDGMQKAISAADYMNRAMANPSTTAQNLELLQYAMDKQLELLNTTKDTVGKIYKAGELYTAIPRLKDIKVGYVYDERRIRALQFDGGIGINLAYVQNLDDLQGAIIHELQHVIDLKLDFTSYNGDFFSDLSYAMKSVERNKHEFYADLVDEGGIVQYFLTDPYERNAYAAQRRRNLNNAQRRAYKLGDVVGDKFLFQTVYHGSAADFDRFDTENYGFSGEGSMSFGYGTYVTGSEEIARDYAERQRPSLVDYLSKFEKGTLENEMYIELMSFDSNIESYKNFLKDEVIRVQEDDIDNPYLDKNAKVKLEKLNDLSLKTHLYTVDIPDKGFIVWDKPVKKQTADKIKQALFKEITSNPDSAYYNYYSKSDLMNELDSVFSYMEGQQLYRNVSAYLEGDKNASIFLYKLGYKGIDYPAGTNYGNGNDARNFVIFNDNDAKITNNLLFQYLQSELDDDTLREAATFNSWEEWYEYAKVMDPDGVVTGAWDAVSEQTWFKSAWESAQKIYNAEPEVSEEDQADKDRNFVDLIKKPGYLEDFLNRAKYYINMQLDSPVDTEEVAEFDRIREMQRFAGNVMADPAHFANDLDDTQKKKLLTMIESSPREYRRIYAELFNDATMAVPEGMEWTVDKSKVPEDMIMELDTMTPAQRREAVKAIEDEQIRQQIESGSLPMDGTLDRYVKVVDADNKKLNKEVERLKSEYAEDLKHINGAQKKALLEEYDRLQEMAAELQSRNIKGNSRISSALSAGAMATSNVVDATENGNYNTIMDRIASLKKMFAGERDAAALIAKADEKARQKVLQNKKKAEAEALRTMKKLRTNTIKRMVRKVSFSNVDYEDARKIIAIQNFLNHWIRTGVNAWIGETEVTADEIWNQYSTDSDFRDEVNKTLSSKKAGQRGAIVRRNLEEALNPDEGRTFSQWTTAERNALVEVLGANDQTIRLNLDALEEYRRTALAGLTAKNGTITEENMRIVYDSLPKDIIARVRYTPMRKWTLEQAEELAKYIDALYEDGKKVYAGKQQLRRDRYEEIRKRIQDTVKDTGITFGPDDTPEEIKKKQEKIAKILGLRTQAKGTAAAANEKRSMREKFMAADRGTGNVRRFARVMDNWTEGVFTDTLCFREYMAYDDEQKSINARTKHIQDYMAEHGITMEKLMEEHDYSDIMDGVKFTTDELLYMYVADKDELSQAAVMYGNFTTAEEKESVKQHEQKYADKEAIKWFMGTAQNRYERVLLDAIQLINTDKDLAGLVQVIENDYASQYERLNRVSIEVFNMPVNRVSAYVPLYRLEASGDTNEQQVAKDILADTTGTPSNYVGRGMTKNRVQISPMNQKPVQLGLFKTWADSMEKTEHFIGYGELVRDLNAIYTSQAASATREAIATRYGQDANNYIKEYINELANPNKGQPKTALDTLVHVLRGQTAPAYLAWKTSGIIKQLCTSPWPFMAYVSPAEYLVSMGEFIKDYSGMSDFVKSRSVFMANRTIDPIIDLIKEAQQKADNKVKAQLANFNKLGMQGLEWADWISVAPGWYAAYKQKQAELENINKKLDNNPVADGYKDSMQIEEEATAYADDVVRLTQPSGRSQDIAPLFKNSAEIAKILLQFQTSLNVIYQNIRFDLPYQIRNKQYKQAAGAIIGYTAAGIMVNAVVSGLFTGDGADDEPEEKLKRAVFYATTQFTDSVPVVGQQMTNITQKLLTGEGYYSNSTLFPVLDTLTKTVTDVAKDNYGKAAEDFAEGVAYNLGLPVSGSKEVLRLLGIGDGEEGLNFKPQALWGRR